MGEVVVLFRVMPESIDVDLDVIEKQIGKCLGVRSITREPIAFGLTALRVIAIIEDAPGGTDPLEQEILKISGVGSVQVLSLTRLI